MIVPPDKIRGAQALYRHGSLTMVPHSVQLVNITPTSLWFVVDLWELQTNLAIKNHSGSLW